MGGASIWHWLVVGLIVMLLFGRGKISEMMGDVAKGIKAFKKGMAEDETTTPVQTTTGVSEPVRSLENHAVQPVGTPGTVGTGTAPLTAGTSPLGAGAAPLSTGAAPLSEHKAG